MDAKQGGIMGIFDKAIDKIEESVSKAREKTGLESDDQSQTMNNTDSGKVNIPPTDDTVKDT